MRQLFAHETCASGLPRDERPETTLTRRTLLRRAALVAAPLAGLLAGACEKPYYDRDRGVMVFRSPDK